MHARVRIREALAATFLIALVPAAGILAPFLAGMPALAEHDATDARLAVEHPLQHVSIAFTDRERADYPEIVDACALAYGASDALSAPRAEAIRAHFAARWEREVGPSVQGLPDSFAVLRVASRACALALVAA